MGSLFSELRRRHVFRVAAAYGVVAWLLIQVAVTVSPLLELPTWVPRLVLLLILLGFPVAVLLAWAFELTPDGFRRTEPLNAADESVPTRGRRSLDSRAAGWVGVGMVTALVGVGAFGWTRIPETGPKTTAVRSLAVLPFANASADPADAYLSDGISDEILSALSQVPQLRVAARTSSFGFRGQNIPLDSIARALKVDHVLEGSIRGAGERVRISARLVDAATGQPVWSHSYNREATDILAVQEEIAVAIANALQVELAGDGSVQLVRSRTADPQAYELYLQGRKLLSERTKASLGEAILRFQAALERDPAFAAAYAGLADAYALSEDLKGLPREEAFPKAIAAAQRALELDDLQAEAHASLGHVYFHQRNWAQSEREYLRAIELNPSYATAHLWYANLLLKTGRIDEALGAVERAYAVDPLSPKIRENRGWLRYFARRYEPAIAWYREQLRADPDNVDLLYWLAWILSSAGEHEEAIATMRRVLDLLPAGESDAWARTRLATAYAAAGQRDAATRMLHALEQAPPGEANESIMAAAYGHLGELDRAFLWLDRAVERDHWMVELVDVDPAFDSLRQDPRFKRVVQQIQ